jgi:hypothetical protein
MIEKALLRRNIKKSANGDFSVFMSKKDGSVVRVLEYAAKRANIEQK